MRFAAIVLTALLAVLLTVNVPATIESCCASQQPVAPCCPPGACECHVATPVSPLPAPDAPATVPVNTHAPWVALLPVSAADCDRLEGAAGCASAASAGEEAGGVPLYVRTHAFLI